MLTIPPAFKYRKYVYLWTGLAVSVIGSQMQVWALFWHIDLLTQQPLALGMVGAARVVPIIVFSIYGGAIADLFDRRKLLFITQSVQAVLSLMLFTLTITDQIQLWHIYTFTALQAIAFSFDLPARQALVPNLVPREVLPNALTMTSMAYQLGAILGPAFSGLMIAGLGLQYTYLLDSISFGAVILALVLMGEIQQDHSLRQTHTHVDMDMIREGLKFTFGHPLIISSMILDFLATFFVSANTLLPIFAREVLGVGAQGYGLLSAAQSTGALLTALVLSQFREIKHQGRTLLISVVIFGFSAVLFGASEVFWLSWIALALSGASDTVSMVIRNTIRQLQTPDNLRGRMTSINQIFFAGGPQLGEIEAGVVGQVWGVQMAAITGGIACVIGVGVAAKIWPQMAAYQGDEENAIGEAA